MEHTGKGRVLFVTLFPIDMNGSASLRNRALIKGLIDIGYTVRLLTISSMDGSAYNDSIVENTSSLEIIRLNQNRVYTSITKQKSTLFSNTKKKLIKVLRKIYHTISIFDNTIFIAKKANKSVIPDSYYDILISSSDPKSSHVYASKLIDQGLKYGKWIQYWGDPLTLDITNKYIYPKWLIRNVEEKIISKASKIVYVSPFTLKEQKQLIPKYKYKMTFLPIPFLKHSLSNKRTMNKEKVTLGYFGDYIASVRNIMPIYNYIKFSNESLIIAGNSDLLLDSLDNINIYPRVQQDVISKLEEVSDILVCILNLKGTQIPGKIYHYAATNKPILVLLDGDNREEMCNYLNEFNRFIICENDQEGIQRAVNEIICQQIDYEPSPQFEPIAIASKFID